MSNNWSNWIPHLFVHQTWSCWASSLGLVQATKMLVWNKYTASYLSSEDGISRKLQFRVCKLRELQRIPRQQGKENFYRGKESWESCSKQSLWLFIGWAVARTEVSLLVCWALALEKAMAPHSGTLAWKTPWMEEPGRLKSMGSLRVGHDWATSLSLFTFMHWRREWQPAPVFLPGESQGRGSLMGCRLWGCTESDTTEAT